MTENQLDILRIGPIDVDIVELPCCPPGEVVICGFGEWCPYVYPTPTPYDTITPTPTTPPCSCYIIKNNSPRFYSCSVNYIECSTGSAIAYLLFAGEQLLICSLTTPFIFGDANCSVQIIPNGYCSNGITCDCTPTPTPTQTPTPSPSPSPTTSPTPTQTPTPTQVLFQNIYDCCTDRLVGTFVNLAEPIYNLTDGVYYFDNLNNAYILSPPTVTLTGCYYIVSEPRSSPIIFYGYTSATLEPSCNACIAANDIICVPPTATPTPTLSPTIWITLPPTATPTPTLYCSCYTVFLFGFTASANFAYNDCSGLPVVSVINQGETYNICASSTPISRSDDFGWAPAGECDENCITPTPTPSSTPTPTPTPTPPPSSTPTPTLVCNCYVIEYNAGIECVIRYTDCDTGILTGFIPIENTYSAITLCSATVPVGINVTFVSGPTPSGLCDGNGNCDLQLTCYEVSYNNVLTCAPTGYTYNHYDEWLSQVDPDIDPSFPYHTLIPRDSTDWNISFGPQQPGLLVLPFNFYNFDVPCQSWTVGYPGLPTTVPRTGCGYLRHYFAPGAPYGCQGFTDYFQIQYEGYIYLEAGNTYDFKLCSDDGSMFTIYETTAVFGPNFGTTTPTGGLQIFQVGNPIIHSCTGGCQVGTEGTISITETGCYPFTLDYYQGPPDVMQLQLSWIVNGIGTWEAVPTTAFENQQCCGPTPSITSSPTPTPTPTLTPTPTSSQPQVTCYCYWVTGSTLCSVEWTNCDGTPQSAQLSSAGVRMCAIQGSINIVGISGTCQNATFVGQTCTIINNCIL